ncbi:MAG: hypothetical protein NXI00_02615 [Cytophagales bacterium]|nr:hypothetical protein [Cytophagales bacterium]
MRLRIVFFYFLSIYVIACKTSQISEKNEEVEGQLTENSLDPDSGLRIDPNLMLVKANCTACHSSKLITMNRMSRERWKETIRWMQEKQNLWDLGESEPLVLDYLEKYYAPESQATRRKNLEAIEWYELKKQE